ncbi:hypothetical protein B0A49_13478, partial [Cryomyces minteri]
MSVDETIASASLQNPSDALEILAHVADRAGGKKGQEHTGEVQNQHTYPTSATNMLSPHDRLLIPSIQLFSNAHDVLYSAKSQQYQQTLGGEYVKYIDDFRVSIRTWHSVWGTLSCSPHLKSSLILSYEYLRLYVNAFAYQATMNRMVAQSNAAAGQRRPSAAFTEVAAMPDARFIYDSIDAAKSLLSIFNSFVDPVACFRFMPL